MCLQISPQNRPDINCISKHKIFDNQFVAVLNKKEIGLFNCKMLFLYHWWQLAGGDIHSELKKQGLIKSSSPILSMPM